MQEYCPPRRLRHVEAVTLRNFVPPFTPSPLYDSALYITLHTRGDLSPLPATAARDALALERAAFVSCAVIGGGVHEWAISVPEDDSSARFATICVRAAKIYRASSPLSSATTTKPLDSQQPEREAPPDAAAFLHGQRVHEEAIVATVDIDLQQLAFEGGAVSADSDFPANMLHLRLADGYYAPHGIATAGSFLRQPPPVSREFSYAKPLSWDDACEGVRELLANKSALSRARDIRGAVEGRAAEAMAERDAGMARQQALAAARSRLQAHRDRRREAESGLRAASAEAERLLNALTRRGDALTAAVDTFQAEQAHLADWRRVVQGPAGAGRLQDAQRALCSRRWRMVRDVALVYPIAPADGGNPGQPAGWLDGTALRGRDAAKQAIPLSIVGLPLDPSVARTPLEGGASSTEPESRERAAAALGYVASAVHLIAEYLGVSLRYPLLPKASRSHVMDRRPQLEFPSSGSSADGQAAPGSGGAATRSIGWGAASPVSAPDAPGRALPLFLDGGPDRTLFAYAVFLLNKDIEQILNAYGAVPLCLTSVSPRHTLHNLLRIYAAAYVVRIRLCPPEAVTSLSCQPRLVEDGAVADGSHTGGQASLQALPWQGPSHPLSLARRTGGSSGVLRLGADGMPATIATLPPQDDAQGISEPEAAAALAAEKTPPLRKPAEPHHDASFSSAAAEAAGAGGIGGGTAGGGRAAAGGAWPTSSRRSAAAADYNDHHAAAVVSALGAL